MAPCDYESIQAQNQARYGTEIGRIGGPLLVDRYDDRTHFIFELLQNAEDAMSDSGPAGDGRVSFHLQDNTLKFTHCGRPFNEADVRGICGIALSTKDLTAIGRFGIGFKSVYAFTDSPEIHSGEEHFAIHEYVLPVAVPAVPTAVGETVILLPIREAEPDAKREIVRGLRGLGSRVLLFLRNIKEIQWSVGAEHRGHYLREDKDRGDGVRDVLLVGSENDNYIEEQWLVFSEPVNGEDGKQVGSVEIAFSQKVTKSGEVIDRVATSPLVAYFPTALETHLGFLVQGPFRTTPSRDNVPKHDQWNQRLIDVTSSLVVQALRWLRDHNRLTPAVLQCLPLSPGHFGESGLFTPIYQQVCQALMEEALIPCSPQGYAQASLVRMAGTRTLRDLFDQSQLTSLMGSSKALSWLDADITADRTPELRNYLIRELGISEVSPESLPTRLTSRFLEAQPDHWIQSLYEYLNGLPGLRRQIEQQPVVRLRTGKHVRPKANGQPAAFLPSETPWDFPTVRESVCESDRAKDFLKGLGLDEPDLVDYVCRNIIPRYASPDVQVEGEAYLEDIRRIAQAHSRAQDKHRDRLESAARDAYLVRAIDTGTGEVQWARPRDTYIPTARLRALFDSVDGVLVADPGAHVDTRQDFRTLLERCGASAELAHMADSSLTDGERSALRLQVQPDQEGKCSEDFVTDNELRGLSTLLELLPNLGIEQRRERSKLLWEELLQLSRNHGTRYFEGRYEWKRHKMQSSSCDAAFVRRLRRTSWVPDSNGELRQPEYVVFDTLDWERDPTLLARIPFKKTIVERLEIEVGLEPGVLEVLKRSGVCKQELEEMLAKHRQAGSQEASAVDRSSDPGGDTQGASFADAADSGVPDGTDAAAPGHSSIHPPKHNDWTSSAGTTGGSFHRGLPSTSDVHRTHSSSIGRREFISYLALGATDDDRDPEGLERDERLSLEEGAIDCILKSEPNWVRAMASNNPGYDLYQQDEDGKECAWCEVKAMKETLDQRSVCLSRAQIEFAREHRMDFWLYIVENAGGASPRILRIRNPFGQAKYFALDAGWREVDHPSPV